MRLLAEYDAIIVIKIKNRYSQHGFKWNAALQVDPRRLLRTVCAWILGWPIGGYKPYAYCQTWTTSEVSSGAAGPSLAALVSSYRNICSVKMTFIVDIKLDNSARVHARSANSTSVPSLQYRQSQMPKKCTRKVT